MLILKKRITIFLIAIPLYGFSMNKDQTRKMEIVQNRNGFNPCPECNRLSNEVKELSLKVRLLEGSITILQDDLREFIDLTQNLEKAVVQEREKEKLPNKKSTNKGQKKSKKQNKNLKNQRKRIDFISFYGA